MLANIKHLLFNEPLEEWEPQTEFLGIIHTGYKHAVSTKAGVCVEGEFIYELKDKIDRNWMKMYQELPNREEMMKQMQEEAKLHPVDKVNQKSIADAMGPSVFELLAKAKMR